MSQVQIAKWGNSFALRVPRYLAERLGLAEGVKVNLEAQQDGTLVITKAKRRYTLEELVAGMTPERQHPSLDDAPRGKEML